MSIIEKTVLIPFLKQRLDRAASLPTHHVEPERAQLSRIMTAEESFTAARQRRRKLAEEIGSRTRQLGKIKSAIESLGRELDQAANLAARERQANAEASLAARLDGVQPPTPNASGAEARAEHLRSELAAAKGQESDQLAKLDTLRADLGKAIKAAFDARAALSLGSVLYLEAQLSNALAEYTAVLRLAGEKGTIISEGVSPDPEAFEGHYERLASELSDLLKQH